MRKKNILVTGAEGFIGSHLCERLLKTGAKKQKLRAHSDYYPNEKANDWALSFWQDFDIQCEAKAKNLASEQLYLQSLTQT